MHIISSISLSRNSLKRPDLIKLTDNICEAFPTEVPSTYFIPCSNGKAPRGKLWCAYVNKRRVLFATGLVTRQRNQKRKLSLDSNDDADQQSAKKHIEESEEFSLNTHHDLETLVSRWEETHVERREELLQGELSPEEYMIKYSVLQSDRGVPLAELDVRIMHPAMGNMDNWLTFYDKVVDKLRDVRKFKHVPKMIEMIDASNDASKFIERYKFVHLAVVC